MGKLTFSGGINNALRVQEWGVRLYHEHQRDQFYYHFTSNDFTNVVHENTDFTKRGGFQMTEGLMMSLIGDGVAGDGIMEDAEEAPDLYSMTWSITQIRNASRTAGEETAQQTNYKLPAELKTLLGEWLAMKRDRGISDQIGSAPTKVYYVNDRAGTSTIVAGDLCTLYQFQRAKTYAASTAYPKLPPLKIVSSNNKSEYRYMGLMHDHVAFDLQVNDPVYQQVVRDAGVRGPDNPLFTGALIDFGGMLLHKHDNCPTSTTWGAGSNIAGAESYLLGRQAVIVGIGGYNIQGKNGYINWVEKRFDKFLSLLSVTIIEKLRELMGTLRDFVNPMAIMNQGFC